MTDIEVLSEEKLDTELEEGDSVVEENEKWEFRVIETEDENYYWQCKVCGKVKDRNEATAEIRNAKLGAMGHARSHDVNKEVSKDKVFEDFEREKEEERDDNMQVESEKKPESRPEAKPKSKPGKSKTKPSSIDGMMDEIERTEDRGYEDTQQWTPYENPMDATDCLKEIFEDYKSRFKSGFMRMMLRRSKRMNGIHPVEFVDYITDMDSGISNNKEARLIAEEYRDLLREEQEKAERLGEDLHMPMDQNQAGSKRRDRPSMGLSMGGNQPQGRGQRSGDDYDREMGYDEPQDTQTGAEGRRMLDTGTNPDVMKMFLDSKDKELERLQQMKQERDELEHEVEKEKQQSEIARLENKMENMMSTFANSLDKIVDKVNDESGSDDSVSRDELQSMMDKQRHKDRADRQEQQLQQMNEKIDKFEDRLETEREEKRELRDELMREKNKGKANPSDWESDDYRMLSSLGSRGLDVAENWVSESKKTRRLLINHLLSEGKITEDQAEQMLEKNKQRSEEEILEEYVEEEDIER